MTFPLLQIDGLAKSFDGISALVKFSCALNAGECLGLIGPNGAGKSTLFNVITGLVKPDHGNIFLRGQEVVGLSTWRITQLGISRTFQKLRLVQSISVLDNVLLHFKSQPGENILSVFLNPRIVSTVEKKTHEEAMELLERCGLEKKSNYMARELSYGQQKLLSIACCLASRSQVLLLDEPIAGVAPKLINNILELIETEIGAGKAILVIEHDIETILTVCDRLIFMDAGTKVCEGDPKEVRNDQRVLRAYIE